MPDYTFVSMHRRKPISELREISTDMVARKLAQSLTSCIRVERNGTVVWRRVPTEAETTGDQPHE